MCHLPERICRPWCFMDVPEAWFCGACRAIFRPGCCWSTVTGAPWTRPYTCAASTGDPRRLWTWSAPPLPHFELTLASDVVMRHLIPAAALLSTSVKSASVLVAPQDLRHEVMWRGWRGSWVTGQHLPDSGGHCSRR